MNTRIYLNSVNFNLQDTLLSFKRKINFRVNKIENVTYAFKNESEDAFLEKVFRYKSRALREKHLEFRLLCNFFEEVRKKQDFLVKYTTFFEIVYIYKTEKKLILSLDEIVFINSEFKGLPCQLKEACQTLSKQIQFTDKIWIYRSAIEFIIDEMKNSDSMFEKDFAVKFHQSAELKNLDRSLIEWKKFRNDCDYTIITDEGKTNPKHWWWDN